MSLAMSNFQSDSNTKTPHPKDAQKSLSSVKRDRSTVGSHLQMSLAFMRTSSTLGASAHSCLPPLLSAMVLISLDRPTTATTYLYCIVFSVVAKIQKQHNGNGME
jgi:hypothetical protein